MPIVIPSSSLIYRVLAIDPGLNNTGVAIFDVNYYHQEVVSITAFTIVNDKLKIETGLDLDIHSERVNKLCKLRFAMRSLLNEVQPVCVVSESPFYNRFRPMAYGALLEVLSEFRGAIMDYNPNIGFTTVAPLLVKSTVGAGAQKGKLDVTAAIKRIPEIANVCKVDIDKLDEHSIDAIAVGHTFIKRRMT